MEVKLKKQLTETLSPKQIKELEKIVETLVNELTELFTSTTLPEGMPSVVYGAEGIMSVFKCSKSKALKIIENEKYQSAFLSPKGTRNRPCNVAKLFELMNKSNNK